MRPTSIPAPLAPMALSALCSWIRNGSPELQTALITDVSWWEESQTILKHQFLILRFDLGGILYDMRIERVGKLITSPTRRAIDRATITRAAAFDEAFYKAHYLLFALLTDRNLVPGSSFVSDAFVDFLDYKWAGPPARLGDLPRYFEVVNGQGPRYSVTHGNCYWFACLLFHTIALRHYAFPLVASRTAPREYVYVDFYEVEAFQDDSWRRHDPSSTGLVFRYIQFQDWHNGGRAFYRMLVKGVRSPWWLVLILLEGCDIAAFYALLKAPLFPRLPPPGQPLPGPPPVWSLLLRLIGILLITSLVMLTAICFPMDIIRALNKRVARRTESILRILDEGADTESIRGAYIPCPPDFPLVQLYNENQWAPWSMTLAARKTQPVTTASTERQLPTLWEHEKQIYAPLKDEYLASFDALRKQAFSRGARLTCHLHPM
ncbi:hypothetical protein C8F01DRAFT_367532 [Mycena amicta]|nr:hypothetical protein C8F01DRAFT_367532 [Mycena amicta]